jgi:hypothetical protein
MALCETGVLLISNAYVFSLCLTKFANLVMMSHILGTNKKEAAM